MNTNFIIFEEIEHLPFHHLITLPWGEPYNYRYINHSFLVYKVRAMHVLEFQRLQKKEDGNFSAR